MAACIVANIAAMMASDRWLDRFISRGELQPTGRLLMTLNEAIAQGFSYQRRSTPGTQEPALTLRVQSGSCRDFALLMMEAARSLGFAARFVTGYIYVPDRDVAQWLGGGSTHAWCQVYVPGSGWIEFDPTNEIVGNRDLIRVAVARMPGQAIPLSGRYWGSADDELGIEVEVNVKTERDSAIPYAHIRRNIRDFVAFRQLKQSGSVVRLCGAPLPKIRTREAPVIYD